MKANNRVMVIEVTTSDKRDTGLKIGNVGFIKNIGTGSTERNDWVDVYFPNVDMGGTNYDRYYETYTMYKWQVLELPDRI